MPKKAAHKKRTGRPVRHKKSFFESLFSFSMPKMFAVVAGAVFLTLMFQFNSSSQFVKGASTAEDLSVVTETQQKAIVAESIVQSTPKPGQPTPAPKPPTFHYVTVFNDTKKPLAKFDEITEDCMGQTFSFNIDNGKKKVIRGANGCNGDSIYSKSRCVTISLNVPSGYKATGVTYSDKTYNLRTVKNTNKAYVCGEVYGYPQTFYKTSIDFGIVKK